MAKQDFGRMITRRQTLRQLGSFGLITMFSPILTPTAALGQQEPKRGRDFGNWHGCLSTRPSSLLNNSFSDDGRIGAIFMRVSYSPIRRPARVSDQG